MLSPERSKSLLLGVRVDISTDDESNNVEEWNPSLLWQEFLRKCEADWRSDPADLHDWPEASFNSCSDLVESASTSDDSHEDQIDRVLDRCDLRARVMLVIYNFRGLRELWKR